jgi:hypothetical protein
MTTEHKIIKRGQKALLKTYEQQKSYGLSLQEKFDTLTNQDILTTALPLREDIPIRYKNKIEDFRERVKQVIFGVASSIQDERFGGLDHEMKKAGLSKFQERRYIKVRDAQKELYASYDAIRISIQYITEFNNGILERIQSASGRGKTDLLLLNALIVYELTDAIVNLVEHFQLNGKQVLTEINQQVFSELDNQDKSDRELWERARNSGTSVEDMVKNSVEERKKIRGIVRQKWANLWTKIEDIQGNVTEAKAYLPTLKLMRDNAKGQIDILEVIGVTQMVESNLDNFQKICELTNIELAPLSKDDVYGLLGKPE